MSDEYHVCVVDLFTILTGIVYVMEQDVADGEAKYLGESIVIAAHKSVRVRIFLLFVLILNSFSVIPVHALSKTIYVKQGAGGANNGTLTPASRS